MGTYSQPGSTVSPYMIDRSAELLSKELGVAGDELIKQNENILISKNKLAENNAILKNSINSAEGGAGLEFKNNLTNMMSNLVDEANILGINSIGRDQTEYINKKSNIMTAVNQLPKILAVLDEEAKMYGDVSDPSRQVLNSTDPLAREFMDNIRIYNGKDIRPEYKDGNIILKYTGKNGKEFVLNSANYMTARKNGTGGLIDYSKDHSAEWKTIFDNLTNDTNYKELQTKLMEESATGKTTVTTREKWEQANEELRRRLENSTTLLPTLDQSTFQLFYPGKEDDLWIGSADQIKDLKGKVIDEIINNYAGTTKITSIVEKERTDTERLDLAAKRVALKKALKNEQESKTVDPASSYVIDISSKLQNAANINDVNSVKEIIETQLASTSGFNPDNIKVEGGTITIQSDAVEQKTYSPEQIKQINEISNKNIGIDIVSDEGFVIDQENMEVLIKENPSFASPNGEVKTKPSDIFVIEDWTSPKGISKLTTIMVDKKFTKAKSSIATPLINKIFDEGKRVEAAGGTEELRLEKIEQIQEDIENFYNNTTPNNIFNYSSGRGEHVYDMIKSLPKDYKVKLYDDEVNPLEYIENNKAATNQDVYDGLVFQILEDAKTNPELKNIDLTISKYIHKGSKKQLD